LLTLVTYKIQNPNNYKPDVEYKPDFVVTASYSQWYSILIIFRDVVLDLGPLIVVSLFLKDKTGVPLVMALALT